MNEFEVTCKVVKGERELAWGEDCYSYYPKPNYNERITRCVDCKYNAKPNEGKHFGICMKMNDSVVTQNGFCAWGRPLSSGGNNA